jgi:hypothetical protein
LSTFGVNFLDDGYDTRRHHRDDAPEQQQQQQQSQLGQLVALLARAVWPLQQLPNYSNVTANCIPIGHFSAFEPGLVASFLYSTLRDEKTAGFEPTQPEI